MKLRSAVPAAALALAMSSTAHAATVTFTDILLGTGLSVMSDGVTMTASTSDGALSNIGGGTFAGLYVGVNDSQGSYTLSFSQAIDSILIEFDALSNGGGEPPETIYNFATNNGPVSIGYTNQFGTSFDGSTITSTENDGQGIIEFAGIPFLQFIFDHNQNPAQNGFVIERIVINTFDGEMPEVPLPAAAFLFLAGVGVIGAAGRKKAAR